MILDVLGKTSKSGMHSPVHTRGRVRVHEYAQIFAIIDPFVSFSGDLTTSKCRKKGG